MKVSGRLVRREPLGWGITKWGPLPDTADLFLYWHGPGDGLYLVKGDRGAHRRVLHSTASGTYGTVPEAEKAVMAFVLAGTEPDTGKDRA